MVEEGLSSTGLPHLVCVLCSWIYFFVEGIFSFNPGKFQLDLISLSSSSSVIIDNDQTICENKLSIIYFRCSPCGWSSHPGKSWIISTLRSDRDCHTTEEKNFSMNYNSQVMVKLGLFYKQLHDWTKRGSPKEHRPFPPLGKIHPFEIHHFTPSLFFNQ